MNIRWGRLASSAAVLLALVSCGGGDGAAPGQQGNDAPPVAGAPSQPPQSTATCSEVAQYGITFTFDHAYACGTFANGDHWIAPDAAGGVVTITAISPAYTGTRNGFEVNPAHVDRQGFDSRSEGFDPTLVPALPYAARGGESVVKSISLVDSPAGRTFLDSAAVLTVLGAIPPEGGANLFRPPYFGADKPLIPLTRVHTERLPKLAPVDYAPSLDDIASRFARVQLDHMNDWTGADIHPVQNLPDYGAQVAEDTADAGLRLMLADSLQAKMPALIGYLQYGIDLAAARHGGLQFAANGGHRIGRKVVLACRQARCWTRGSCWMTRTSPPSCTTRPTTRTRKTATCISAPWLIKCYGARRVQPTTTGSTRTPRGARAIAVTRTTVSTAARHRAANTSSAALPSRWWRLH